MRTLIYWTMRSLLRRSIVKSLRVQFGFSSGPLRPPEKPLLAKKQSPLGSAPAGGSCSHTMEEAEAFVNKMEIMFLTSLNNTKSISSSFLKEYELLTMEHKIRLLRRLRNVKLKATAANTHFLERLVKDLQARAHLLSLEELNLVFAVVSSFRVLFGRPIANERSAVDAYNKALLKCLATEELAKPTELMDIYTKWTESSIIHSKAALLVEQRLARIQCFKEWYDLPYKVEINGLSFSTNFCSFLKWIPFTKHLMLGLGPDLQKYLRECANSRVLSGILGKESKRPGSNIDGVYLLLVVEPRIWWLADFVRAQAERAPLSYTSLSFRDSREIINDTLRLGCAGRFVDSPELAATVQAYALEALEKLGNKDQYRAKWLVREARRLCKVQLAALGKEPRTNILLMLLLNDVEAMRHYMPRIVEQLNSESPLDACQLAYYSDACDKPDKFARFWQMIKFWSSEKFRANLPHLECAVRTPIKDKMIRNHLAKIAGEQAEDSQLLYMLIQLCTDLDDFRQHSALMARQALKTGDYSYNGPYPNYIFWAYVHHVQKDYAARHKMVSAHLFLKYYAVLEKDVLWIESFQQFDPQAEGLREYLERCLWMRRLSFCYEARDLLPLLESRLPEVLRLDARIFDNVLKLVLEYSQAVRDNFTRLLAKEWTLVSDPLCLAALARWLERSPHPDSASVRALILQRLGAATLGLDERLALSVAFSMPQDPAVEEAAEMELWRLDFYKLWLLVQGHAPDGFYARMLESRFVSTMRLREVLNMLAALRQEQPVPEAKSPKLQVLAELERRSQFLLGQTLTADRISIHKYQREPHAREFPPWPLASLLLDVPPVSSAEAHCLEVLEYLRKEGLSLTPAEADVLVRNMAEYQHPGKVMFFMQLFLVCPSTKGQLLREMAKWVREDRPSATTILDVFMATHEEEVREVWKRLWEDADHGRLLLEFDGARIVVKASELHAGTYHPTEVCCSGGQSAIGNLEGLLKKLCSLTKTQQ